MKPKERAASNAVISSSRWAVYAAAGAASALAAAPAAEAEIHYSGILNEAVVGTRVNLPLDEGHSLTFFQRSGDALVFIDDGSNGAFAAPRPFYGSVYADNLPKGASLRTQQFNDLCVGSSSGTFSCRATAVIGNGSGYFEQPGVGAIGFVFYGTGQAQYGWARIRTTGAPDYKLVVIDYAWGDPGQKIRVGQKPAPQTAAAEGRNGSLGLLAAGGAGLEHWREARRSPAAAK